MYICIPSVLLCGLCLCVTHDCVHAQWKVGVTFNFIWQVMSILSPCRDLCITDEEPIQTMKWYDVHSLLFDDAR